MPCCRCYLRGVSTGDFQDALSALLGKDAPNLSPSVIARLAKSVQPMMKPDLREVWMAPDRAAAQDALEVLVKKSAAKYGKAVECLTKDRDALLASSP